MYTVKFAQRDMRGNPVVVKAVECKSRAEAAKLLPQGKPVVRDKANRTYTVLAA